MKTLLFILLLPILGIAQNKPGKFTGTRTDKHTSDSLGLDTIKLKLKPRQIAVFQEYETAFNQIDAQAKQAEQQYKAELQRVLKIYRDLQKMIVEEEGGDSEKFFTVKNGEIHYLKAKKKKDK